MLKQAFLYKALFSRSPKWLILALHVVLVCFMIFPGTMFAVICKQERSVCYLLRLSKSQSIIQLGDSTQSKQIRKMYFNASFIKSIIISIYSLTISTISSHSFLLVIIFNQWHKKKKLQEGFHGNWKLPEKCCQCVEHSSNQPQGPNLLVSSVFWGENSSQCHNSSSPLRKHLHFCQKPYFTAKNILVPRFLNSRTWPRAENAGATLGWCWDLGFCDCSCPLAGLWATALLLQSTWCVLSFNFHAGVSISVSAGLA